jgi:exodeoxyribonuclease VII large subunit
MADWIGRLGRVWVDGQITELNRRGTQQRCFFVLRDTAAEMSLQVSAPAALLDAADSPLSIGSRVVVWIKPDFYVQRGSLSMTAYDIRPVGVGALLARLEQLRKTLAAEGLFAAERKRALPFLPGMVGLVTGRASAAERDVVENARRRWPAVRFKTENVAVQGAYAVTEVVAALTRLDADPEVDVIVLARGGGSMEDLLPFSDEILVRAVSAARTPIVTAIGHESDVPLVDHAADRRASTPTDAGKLVVPDMQEERARILGLHERVFRCAAGRVETEQERLGQLLDKPAFRDRIGQLTQRSAEVSAWRERGRRATLACLAAEGEKLGRLGARVMALSPKATLDRGYAVLQRADGAVVRAAHEVRAGDALSARLAEGRLALEVARP